MLRGFDVSCSEHASRHDHPLWFPAGSRVMKFKTNTRRFHTRIVGVRLEECLGIVLLGPARLGGLVTLRH